MAGRPNILFIFTDQQSASMMSCTGNRYLQTPAMDSLAHSGLRFERAYCTNPVCVPSRFSLMTGRMPSAIGMLSNSIKNLATSPNEYARNGLGWLMRRAGYETVYGGKVHLPMLAAEDIGFDSLCPDSRDRLAAHCAEFIWRRRDRPFCLVASFTNPHDICYMAIRDFATNENYRRMLEASTTACRNLDEALRRPEGVDDEDFFSRHCPPLPPNFEPQADEPEAIQRLIEARAFRLRARREWSPRRWREHRWAYHRLTEMVDAQIAVVLDALVRNGQADNTLVVFSSDHGDMDSSHRMEHKSMLYEEACRVPLIVRAPGMRSIGGSDGTHLVSNGLDLLPTFCDYAGIEPPPDLAGRSLRPIIEGEKKVRWRAALPVECVVGRAMVTDRFKYCRYDFGVGAEQLIDLTGDPGETRNALAEPHHARVLQSMRSHFNELFGDLPRDPLESLKAIGAA